MPSGLVRVLRMFVFIGVHAFLLLRAPCFQDRCTQGMIDWYFRVLISYRRMPGANWQAPGMPLLLGVDDEAEIGLELGIASKVMAVHTAIGVGVRDKCFQD